MEDKEIEQRIDDAVNEIPLESILQESKNRLETKIERYDENRKNKHFGQNWRYKAIKLRNAQMTNKKYVAFGMKCIKIIVLIMLCMLVYQLLLRHLFS